MGLAVAASFDGIQWNKLEEEIFGESLYKLILRRRGR
jgi:hypothetical protein